MKICKFLTKILYNTTHKQDNSQEQKIKLGINNKQSSIDNMQKLTTKLEENLTAKGKESRRYSFINQIFTETSPRNHSQQNNIIYATITH